MTTLKYDRERKNTKTIGARVKVMAGTNMIPEESWKHHTAAPGQK